jgi:D-galactarolactone cycloisomerase
MQDTDRIIRIDGFEIVHDMAEPAGNALRVFTRRGALLVRLTTESGASGWGETWAFPAAASAMIRSTFGASVIGSPACAPVRLQAELLSQVVPDRRGQAHMAISALDIAAWDLWGRVSGRSVADLMGGRLRDSVLAYASGPLLVAGPDRYAGLAEALRSYREAGYRAFKLRVGVSLAEDERAIRLAREIVGPDVPLMVDLNEASTIHDALALANRVADCNIGWFEEPLRHDDLPGYRRMAGMMPGPIAGGESFCGIEAFRDALCAGTLEVVQPDIALCGGLTETMRISALADAFGTRVAPHVWGTGVNTLAALQVCAVLRARTGDLPMPLLECDMSDNPMREAIYPDRPDSQGHLPIPAGPGLGRDITPDLIEPFLTNHWVME